MGSHRTPSFFHALRGTEQDSDFVFIVAIFCSFQKFLNEDTDHEAELCHEELSYTNGRDLQIWLKITHMHHG